MGDKMGEKVARLKAEVPTKVSYLPRFGLDEGPVTEVHAFWLAGLSCDGCSIAAVGAQNPTVEQLISGSIPGYPRSFFTTRYCLSRSAISLWRHITKPRMGRLVHHMLSFRKGQSLTRRSPGEFGGYWSAMGVTVDEDGTQTPIPTAHWLRDLAPGAAAVIAVGTCATWGGVPAAAGNLTNAMSVMDYLGKEYLSTLGLPPVNIPGCAPLGDNITETITSVLMFLAGFGPLPEFDELGRPAWMFQSTVHRGCVRAGNYEEGKFADEYGQKECLVELGCWGPVVQCNMVSRGPLVIMGVYEHRRHLHRLHHAGLS